MSLLEKLAQKEEIRIDFHNHLHTGSALRKQWKTAKGKIKALIYQEGFYGLTGILDKIINSNLDVLYLTNFADSRYEDWTSPEQVERAINDGYKIEVGSYYTTAEKNGKVVVLGKSQEVPTAQGHVLFAGLERDKRFEDRKSLEETLSQADDNELKIADHPYAILEGNGVLSNAIQTKEGHEEKFIRSSLKRTFQALYNNFRAIFSKKIKRAREETAKKFDAFEKNGNYPFPLSIANYQAAKYAKKYNLPLIADSDGHHPKDIGRTYNTLSSSDLDYSSEKAFRDSINDAIKEGKFETHFRAVPFWRIFHHIVMLIPNRIMKGYGNLARKER